MICSDKNNCLTVIFQMKDYVPNYIRSGKLSNLKSCFLYFNHPIRSNLYLTQANNRHVAILTKYLHQSIMINWGARKYFEQYRS